MGVWNGIGLNYKSRNPEVIAFDNNYFQGIGARPYIRVHIPAFNGSAVWNSATYKTWRDTALLWRLLGYDVMFGIAWGNINHSEWQRYHDHCVAEAAYCLQIGAANEFNIGNEGEMHLNGMTLVEFRQKTRELATDVKAVFPAPNKVIYTFPNFSIYGDGWIAEGVGDMDYLGGNVYGNYNPTTKWYNRNNYRNQIPKMVNGLGSKYIITEFNVEAEAAKFNVFRDDEERFEDEFAEMYRFIKASGVERAMLYQYRAGNDIDAGDSFFLRYNDNRFEPAWNAVVSNNGRRIYVP